ncbi:hypothetical protein LXL04_011864 [Taraxacum kok-saghyz]
MVPTNPYAHVNEDLSAVATDARRKRQRRCLMSVVIIAGIVAGLIVLFSVTAGRFRTPKFRVRYATFETLNVGNSTANPSFNIEMNTEFGIKNTNFRRFWYRSTTVDFYYREQKVGDGFVWNERVKVRDTRKFTVPVSLSSMNVTSSSELRSDLNGGVLPLRSRSRRDRIGVSLGSHRFDVSSYFASTGSFFFFSTFQNCYAVGTAVRLEIEASSVVNRLASSFTSSSLYQTITQAGEAINDSFPGAIDDPHSGTNTSQAASLD